MTLRKMTPDDSLLRAKSLDRICDRFELACISGASPRIEDYLDQVGNDERMHLLFELVTLEVQWSREMVDIPSLQAVYQQRFPELPVAFFAHLVANQGKADDRPEITDDAQFDTAVWRKDAELETPIKSINSAEKPPRPVSLGRYEVINQIGRGGMGEVYLGRDPQLSRLVAIKVPRHDGAGEAKREFVNRFCREAQAAASVRHPHVCPIYDVGDDNGVPYVVMAYVKGETLAERIRRLGRYESEHAAIQLTIDVAAALQAVHAEGIVHRDLKPGNILLDTDGQPFLTDFGLAYFDDGQDHLTVVGTVLGTPAYMAPEQVSSGGDRAGPTADVYSLGVILYELLTGQVPYDGDSLRIMAMKVASKPPKPISDWRPEIDPALAAVIAKAMECDPGLRFATAAEFADALAHYLSTESAPFGSTKPNWLTHLAKPSPFYRKQSGVLAIAILLLVSLSAGSSIVGWIHFGSSQALYPTPATLSGHPAIPNVEITSPISTGVGSVTGSGENKGQSPLMEGELVVTVSRNANAGLMAEQSKLLTDTNALPIRPGDQLHIEARLNRPGYVYVLWIDSEGAVFPLFPWDFGHSKLLWDAPLVLNANKPRTIVHIPELVDEGLDVSGRPGTQSIVLLASLKPLPRSLRLCDLVGTFESRPEVATHIAQVSSRTRGLVPGSAQKMTDPVAIQVEERLRDHFDLIHVVSFAQVD